MCVGYMMRSRANLNARNLWLNIYTDVHSMVSNKSVTYNTYDEPKAALSQHNKIDIEGEASVKCIPTTTLNELATCPKLVAFRKSYQIEFLLRLRSG